MRPLIRLDQAGDHVEHGGLAGAIRPQQPDGFAAPDIKTRAFHDLAAREALFQPVRGQKSFLQFSRSFLLRCSAAAQDILDRGNLFVHRTALLKRAAGRRTVMCHQPVTLI